MCKICDQTRDKAKVEQDWGKIFAYEIELSTNLTTEEREQATREIKAWDNAQAFRHLPLNEVQAIFAGAVMAAIMRNINPITLSQDMAYHVREAIRFRRVIDEEFDTKFSEQLKNNPLGAFVNHILGENHEDEVSEG